MNTIASSETHASPGEAALLLDAARAACSRIAPLWPLQHFVAVNPFLGLADRPFTDACQLMSRLLPGGMQMPASYYAQKFAAGELTAPDLSAALAQAGKTLPPAQAALIAEWTPATLRAALAEPAAAPDTLPTVAEAVDRQHGSAWAAYIVESISHFSAAYYDAGQSAWRMPWRHLPLFQAWREHALLDADPEIHGLAGFRGWVRSLPADGGEAIARLIPLLRLEADPADYLHKQLLTIRGWAGYVQYRVREQSMHDHVDDSLRDLLAIRLAWDAALLARYDSPALREFWPAPGEASPAAMLQSYLFQLAEEHAWLTRLTATLQTPAAVAATPARPAVQAVFCIDVRSEVFRRALESASPAIHTLGFAGFFGLPVEVVPFGQRKPVAQCPVLLTPKYRVHETLPGVTPQKEQQIARQQRLARRITHSWNSFKTSAITCFSFVETAGLAFGAKLFRNTFAPAAHTHSHHHGCCPSPDPASHGDGGIPLPERVALARGALRNMGLTRDFARLVLLCGHGSTTTNNPYAAGLDCGACGGHAGDTNARLAAAILNDPRIRAALAEDGLSIPADTWFLGALHDTTTDEVRVFDIDHVPATHQCDLAELQGWLALAGTRARTERAAHLGLESTDPALREKVALQGNDWSQVRPEWGLAGNAAFIAAPRHRTRHAHLGGRVFLHSYDHRTDTDGSVLELIMCAPMIVANWINLQYYASTVNNSAFGSGNKTIHNVVGTLGVCLGNGGDLQTGLPLQSVSDGSRWMHEPLRLHVVLEAPRHAIDTVLARHAHVRQLVDHGWLLLFALEDDGAALHRHLPGGRWERVS
ncbi:hypothetical protein TSACC_2756 [Terrimicrobium sacchariphilum]|uniref:Probable inorganic carbon transporter subunit DabA n=1 Tax=Terrimicrobium sacchariphilum TaxID=690879 RepID=A0A146G6D8_TERSA|nr:DUF2309 domain-containing protein [Terrimicrobium sacchariphilum]GAT32358.1 hypothetical protein TSACC_2756 [Terrimicrobium sacchariphilum]